MYFMRIHKQVVRQHLLFILLIKLQGFFGASRIVPKGLDSDTFRSHSCYNSNYRIVFVFPSLFGLLVALPFTANSMS